MMLRSVSFTIPGRLRGKGRPRAAQRGKFIRMYTDAATQSHEAIVRQYAAEAMRATQALEGPVSMQVAVSMHMPESWSKKRKAYTQYAVGKPDPDNIVKLIADAVNRIVYADDSQIADLRFVRRYDQDYPECVAVTFAELPDAFIRDKKVAA